MFQKKKKKITAMLLFSSIQMNSDTAFSKKVVAEAKA